MDGRTGADEPDHPQGQGSQRPDDAATATADGLCWRQAFAGEGRRLSEVRAWLASLLPPCTARDDVLSIATELGANAIRHTSSGHGGSFTVEVAWRPPVARVAVADGGGLTEPRVRDDPLAEHGRGLRLVGGLADRVGVDGDQDGRRVWAEVTWNGPVPAAPATSPAISPSPVGAAASNGSPSPRPVTASRAVVPASADRAIGAPW